MFTLTQREAGILMPIASLPSRHGIGEFGPEAYKFIDLISKTQLKYWQILPLNPLGFGNSPYQPYSSFAGDEIYIYLEDMPHYDISSTKIDYDGARNWKEKYLREAYNKFEKDEDYEAFKKKAFWLDDYAHFMTMKKQNSSSWQEWKNEKEDLEEVEYQCFIQYLFYKQWMDIKAYANKKGIQIIGDMPMYVGLDSADVYYSREDFLLDEDGYPTSVAGVPPDYFSKDGQLWGNPLYDWEKQKKDGYQFWMKRLSWNKDLYDIIRIDHFRAFDTYWSIPAKEKTARHGEWLLGPSYDFFDQLFKVYPDIKLIAEDLGDLREEVLTLKDHYHLLGMRIGQYSLGKQEEKEGFKLPEYCIVYTGTHDNDSVKGWYDSQSKKEKRRVRRILHRYKGKAPEKILRFTLDSDCILSIIPVQDFIFLGGESRLNTPGTVGSPNWEWKLRDFYMLESKLGFIRQLLNEYDR